MWKEEDGKLIRDFKFQDFSEAWGFLTRMAMLVEKVDHHPTWSNTYNRIRIELTTHNAGNKVTQKDKDLAQGIDLIYSSYMK